MGRRITISVVLDEETIDHMDDLVAERPRFDRGRYRNRSSLVEQAIDAYLIDIGYLVEAEDDDDDDDDEEEEE
jgi:Arc/MetJ-type ribon-helix-helix transcriptional regulator